MKIALASCNGMSPNALVSRVAVGDVKKTMKTWYQYVWVQHQQILKV